MWKFLKNILSMFQKPKFVLPKFIPGIYCPICQAWGQKSTIPNRLFVASNSDVSKDFFLPTWSKHHMSIYRCLEVPDDVFTTFDGF